MRSAEYKAVIASQAEEIQTLRFDLQRANQAHETIEREMFADHSRQAALIQSMREAIENAPHPDCCAGWWKAHRYASEYPCWIGVRVDLCNCWKSRALAQVSASPKEEQA